MQSLFESCYVEVNGKMYGSESMRVKVDGETFRFKDMCDVTLHYWNKGYPATIIIDEPGGLEVGKEYRVSAVVTIRAYYMREGIAAQLAGTQVKMPSAEKRILIHNSFYLIWCNSVSDKADDYGKIRKMLKELARHCLIKKDCDLKTYYNQMQNRCYNPDMMTWYDNQMHWYKYLIDELTEETRYHTPEIALQASLLADGIFLSQQEGRSVTAEEIKEKSQSLAIWHQETPWGIFDYDSQI